MESKSKLEKSVKLETGITAKQEGMELILKGPKGETRKSMASAQVVMKVESDNVKFVIPKNNRHHRKAMNSFVAHAKNMQKGVTEGHHYLLRICSGHFPMNVTVSKNEFVVKNYVGERVPRSMKLPSGVEVKVNGRDITVDSTDKNLAGMVASRIEGLTKRANFDKRRFQDGIYIVIKDGKEVR
ncbi:MAG TPA: 50S ribosomal protein L6 [Candidatus Nanoarchaeia archaeon]|nr:50S ribosomal protein L6 [Candidatus Nanoarchaeia archaeon]